MEHYGTVANIIEQPKLIFHHFIDDQSRRHNMNHYMDQTEETRTKIKKKYIFYLKSLYYTNGLYQQRYNVL